MNAESREIVLSDPARTDAVCCTLVLPAALNASAEFIARRVVRHGPGRALVMAIDGDGYLELRETLMSQIETAPPAGSLAPQRATGQVQHSLPGVSGAGLIAGGRAGDSRRLFETAAGPALIHAMTERDLLLVCCRDEQECLQHIASLAQLARIVVHAAAEDAELRARLATLFAAPSS